VSHVEKVSEAYRNYEDAANELWRFLLSALKADRLTDEERYLLPTALSRLDSTIDLIKELPSVDWSGKHIDRGFVIERIQKATGLLREALDILQHEDPSSHRRKELAMNISSYAMQAMNDTIEMLRKALETTGQEGEKA
jgi:hypothetical protein